jgi:hypothetical protein
MDEKFSFDTFIEETIVFLGENKDLTVRLNEVGISHFSKSEELSRFQSILE